eukprot:13004455-Alexandrium_andersonii.AAC.1
MRSAPAVLEPSRTGCAVARPVIQPAPLRGPLARLFPFSGRGGSCAAAGRGDARCMAGMPKASS